MSDKTYATVVGFVQQFPGKPAVTAREVSGIGTIHEFMVRAVGFTGQPLVKVTLFPERAASAARLTKGTFIAADGEYKQNPREGGGVWHNLNANSGFAILDGEEKDESNSRTVVNAVSQGTEAPF